VVAADGTAGTKVSMLAVRSERWPEARSFGIMAGTLNFTPGVIESH